jgi:hypothetical protein
MTTGRLGAGIDRPEMFDVSQRGRDETQLFEGRSSANCCGINGKVEFPSFLALGVILRKVIGFADEKRCVFKPIREAY